MLATLLLLIAAPTEAFTGKVVGVTDGDTIVDLSEQKQIKVRLEGRQCYKMILRKARQHHALTTITIAQYASGSLLI